LAVADRPEASDWSAGLLEAMDTAADGIVLLDGQWACVHANDAACALLACESDGLEGTVLDELLPDHAARIRHRRRQPKRTFKPLTVRVPDHARVTVRVFAAEAGTVLHLSPTANRHVGRRRESSTAQERAGEGPVRLARQILQAEQYDRRRLARQ